MGTGFKTCLQMVSLPHMPLQSGEYAPFHWTWASLCNWLDEKNCGRIDAELLMLEEAISDCLALSQSNCTGALWAIWKDHKRLCGEREKGNEGRGEEERCPALPAQAVWIFLALEVKCRHLWVSSSIYHLAITYKNSEPDRLTKPLLNSWPQKERPSLSHLPIDPH